MFSGALAGTGSVDLSEQLNGHKTETFWLRPKVSMV